jgi:hypothetical protein
LYVFVLYFYIVIVTATDKFKAKADKKVKSKQIKMQAVYETLTKPEMKRLKKYISVKGNLKLAERSTNLNVNTIKRAAAGMQVTVFSVKTLRDFITTN